MASYAAVTNECNGCHRSSGYAAIAIQILVPDQLFVDQGAEGRSLAHSSRGTCHVVADAARGAPAPRLSAGFQGDRQLAVILGRRAQKFFGVKSSSSWARSGAAKSDALGIPDRGDRRLSGDDKSGPAALTHVLQRATSAPIGRPPIDLPQADLSSEPYPRSNCEKKCR